MNKIILYEDKPKHKKYIEKWLEEINATKNNQLFDYKYEGKTIHDFYPKALDKGCILISDLINCNLESMKLYYAIEDKIKSILSERKGKREIPDIFLSNIINKLRGIMDEIVIEEATNSFIKIANIWSVLEKPVVIVTITSLDNLLKIFTKLRDKHYLDHVANMYSKKDLNKLIYNFEHNTLNQVYNSENLYIFPKVDFDENDKQSSEHEMFVKCFEDTIVQLTTPCKEVCANGE